MLTNYRYGYVAELYKGSEQSFDENYNPIEIEAEPIPFVCDYQPTPALKISSNGSFINIAYKLFVPNTVNLEFTRGENIRCNNIKGTLVEVYKTSLNIELWVK